MKRERERGVAKREDRGASMSRSISRPPGNNVDLPASCRQAAKEPHCALLKLLSVFSAPVAFFL